ncbi:hypothetical protein MHYP_G00344100 [Metynnis hypsauchen]
MAIGQNDFVDRVWCCENTEGSLLGSDLLSKHSVSHDIMLVEVKRPNPAPIKQCQYPSKAHLYLKTTIESLKEFSENTEQEHLLLLDKLFTLLTEGLLKMNPKKLQQMKRKVTFLESVISEGGHIPDPCRVENLPLPQSVTALRSWLGLAGF